jgi:LmbE family N-acetylglucosaminyl deacetylase
MSWIYLSPHLDDVVLSCGGLLWEQAQAGESASIWTICAGDAPPGSFSSFAESLHQRWQTADKAPATRRKEDLAACAIVGAECRHFSTPDCIYRRGEDGELLYPLEDDILGPFDYKDSMLIDRLADEITQFLPTGARLVSPLAIGNHLDHRLVRDAAEKTGHPLLYYADYPYVAENTGPLEELIQEGWQPQVYPVSAAGLEAWIQAVGAYKTQISTFWPDREALAEAITAYSRECWGARLWFALLK